MSSAPDEKILCYCRNVRYGEVRAAIERVDARNVQQVMDACTAGTGCRTCHPEIEDLIAERAESRKGGLMGFFKKLFSR